VTVKRDQHDDWRSVGRRNESDMRMVSGIVGVVVGGFTGFYVVARALPYTAHRSPLLMLIVPLVAAIIGGVIGYFQDTWRSSL
jgi:hypothetical protein